MGWGLYSGELGVWHLNSRTESISKPRLASMISFRFLDGDRTRLCWLRFHSESVETGLAMPPIWVQGATWLRVAWRASARHERSGPRVAATPGRLPGLG
jgi:hypothetical protein